MTRARVLTEEGVTAARRFLAEVRANPSADTQPPEELIFDGVHTKLLPGGPDLTRPQDFTTRRDAAEYLADRLAPIRHRIADDAGFWSWLGMYYFTETAPRDKSGTIILSPLDETFVVHRGEPRSYQRRYRHYLWSAWRLHQAHGESAAYLLDQSWTSWPDIAERAFGSPRIFNSVGVVSLILALYTDGKSQKRQISRTRGGLRHLIRVLAQLERTYDVYGMSTDALLNILPPDFDRWKPTPLS